MGEGERRGGRTFVLCPIGREMKSQRIDKAPGGTAGFDCGFRAQFKNAETRTSMPY